MFQPVICPIEIKNLSCKCRNMKAVRLKQENVCTAVFEQKADSFFRIIRVNGQISAARFKNAINANQHFRRTPSHNGNCGFRFYSPSNQLPGDTVSLFIQFFIGHRSSFKDNGCLIRRFCCLLFECMVERLIHQIARLLNRMACFNELSLFSYC